jgi:membrane protein
MSTTLRRHSLERDALSGGWWSVVRRLKDDISADNLSIVAAGAAFFGLLAVFPALAAGVALYGLVTDPATVTAHTAQLAGLAPEGARSILEQQLQRVTGAADRSLGIGAVVALLVALWSSTKGVKSLMRALDIVYDEEEDRGFFALNGTALLLTLAMIVIVPLSLAVVAVLPAVIDRLPLPELAVTAARWLRWPLIGALSIGVIAVLYRFGPAHSRPRPKWAWRGAAVATVLWLVASALFSWYVSSFGTYNETYGSVGAIAVLMMWLWLSAFAVLLGGEIDVELEPRVAPREALTR